MASTTMPVLANEPMILGLQNYLDGNCEASVARALERSRYASSGVLDSMDETKPGGFSVGVAIFPDLSSLSK